MRRSKILFVALSFSVFATFGEERAPVGAVQAPRMPTVSAVKTPSLGSGFYVPKIDDFYPGATIRNSPKPQNAPKTSETENKTQEQKLTEKISEIAGLSKSTNSILSAQDLSFLDTTGNFSTVSNLLAGKKNLSAVSTLASGDITSSANSTLLNQILANLNDVKTATPKLAPGQELPLPRDKDNARILRFFVNGYDLLATCKTVYFSDKESDGTFLLTGDRVYNSNNQSRTETFYMLFKAVGNEGGVTTYKVAPDVTQDYENKYSFLYQLTTKNNLTAEKTGNLITLKVKDVAWNMDLLIDAGAD